ncbi:MAG: ATP synthase F1 subunit delta [Armatimonadetes bacterium]|nr:ATP synthase F1 subunit delta [Armatimonadota bacterium]MDE2205907.1 ATP synthase F1 subunit delta [Armatimonadota bacterium]
MATIDFRVARRYASAVFAAASKARKVDAVTSDLAQFSALVGGSASLQSLWRSPLIPASSKEAAVVAALKGKCETLTVSLLTLLIAKSREEMLPGVVTELQRLADAAKGVVRAEAVFALPPTPDQIGRLRRSLELRTGQRVELTVDTEPAVLGGVLVRLQDTLIDGTVRGSLERMRDHLLAEAQS